jgi:hypothetical protein
MHALVPHATPLPATFSGGGFAGGAFALADGDLVDCDLFCELHGSPILR